MNVTSVFRFSDGFLSLTYNRRILLAVVSHREWFRQPGFRIARSTLHSPLLMLLHISSRYRRSVLNSFGSTLDSCSVSCTGSNEETGCSLEFLTSFAAFSTDLASIDYFRSVDRRHDTTPRSCRTDVANTAADLSETPVRSQALASEGRGIVIFWHWCSGFGVV